MRLRNSTTRSRLAAWVAPRRLIVERLEERRGLLGRLGQGRPRAALTRLDVERLEDRCLLSTIDMGTRSIVAADPATGQVGIAVVSFPTGVPAVVPVGEPGVIVADQAFPSYADSQAIIADIKQGDDAPTALAKVVPTDPDAAIRQFAVAALSPTSPSGVTVGTFTGSSAPAEKCALTGPTYAVVGDLQTSSAVCSAMAAGFTSAQGSLSRRLLDALLAGTPVGQDKRGEFSAVVRVFSSTWALANFTPISADAHVDRSANWQGDLKFGLDAWLSILTPGDRADLVELTTAKAQAIQGVLQALGYFNGKIDGDWTGQSEKALKDFSNFNLFFTRGTVKINGTLFIDSALADYIVTGFARGVLKAAPSTAAQAEASLHTRSIVAADPATGQVGIAVVSFPTGVPAIVPVGEPGVIVANQAIPSYADARAIIANIKNGDDAPTALAKAVAADPDPSLRQFGVAALSPSSPSGATVATFTGSSIGTTVNPEACGLTGSTFAVQANLQTSSALCGAMADGFTSAQGSFPRRLLAGLLAGTPVGTDKRGEFSASIRVFSSTWALASFAPISAESSVDRSANWQGDLKFGLDAWLAIATPGDPADLVELTIAKAQAIQGVLQALGYFKGKVDGDWTGESEKALKDFSNFNLFFTRGTAKINGTLFLDAALADYIVTGFARSVLRPNPKGMLMAAVTAPVPVNETLSADQVQPLLTEAVTRWHGAGLDTSGLSTIEVRIADLPGATLGEAIGHTIWLDSNAAGWGWYVDATPWDDSEFTAPGNQGEQDRMDLLTALAHEAGHVLGFEHSDDGLMAETLATAERHMPLTSSDVMQPILIDLVLFDKKKKWLTEPVASDPLHDLVALLR